MTPNTIIITLAMVFILFRVATRVRRNIGRQRLKRTRLTISIVIISVFTCLLSAAGMHNPKLLLGLGLGLVSGALLGLVGLRLTRFEATAEGQFYTPNAYIGVALSVLFVGRILYRLFLLSNAQPGPTQIPSLLNSPMSFFIFEVLAGYYISYYVGLLTRKFSATAVIATPA